MMMREAHELTMGQRFSWSSETPDSCEVIELGIIDRDGYELFLYTVGAELHGHPFDHTPVYLIN